MDSEESFEVLVKDVKTLEVRRSIDEALDDV